MRYYIVFLQMIEEHLSRDVAAVMAVMDYGNTVYESTNAFFDMVDYPEHTCRGQQHTQVSCLKTTVEFIISFLFYKPLQKGHLMLGSSTSYETNLRPHKLLSKDLSHLHVRPSWLPIYIRVVFGSHMGRMLECFLTKGYVTWSFADHNNCNGLWWWWWQWWQWFPQYATFYVATEQCLYHFSFFMSQWYYRM